MNTPCLRVSLLCGLALLIGCSDSPPKKAKGQSGVRSAAVQPKTTVSGPVNDKSGFCELVFPGSGPKARPLVWPAFRPLPGESAAITPKAARGQWLWVNLWATWCEPCLAEMGLLARWVKGLNAGRAGMTLELLTIDAPENAQALGDRIRAGLPGTVRWIRDDAEFGGFLDRLGVDRTAAIEVDEVHICIFLNQLTGARHAVGQTGRKSARRSTSRSSGASAAPTPTAAPVAGWWPWPSRQR